MSRPTTGKSLNLHSGEWVEVRSASEILATLDGESALEGLPFMPEMLQYCGKRVRVFKSAHKTCDTVESYTIRRMADAVHLEGLRCDGEAHGGCQAGCLLFWKEAWLRRCPEGGEATGGPDSAADPIEECAAALEGLYAASRSEGIPGRSGERYRCQATDLLKATDDVRRRERWNPLFYVKDVTSGNVTIWQLAKYGAFAILNNLLLKKWGWRYPRLCGEVAGKTPESPLGLRPGECIQVKAKSEVVKTLNAKLTNRGLSFDVEMVPYCENGPFKVLRKVERIINEKTGYMMKLPSPCIILDGVTCSGNLSTHRLFCPRSIYPYWHEIWLKRMGTAEAGSVDSPEAMVAAGGSSAVTR
jgi:hypothetical protein